MSRCSCNFYQIHKTNYNIFLCLGDTPYGTIVPRSTAIYEGSRISIRCYSAGPMQWFFNELAILSDNRRKILNHVIRINDAISSHTGRYTCKGLKPKQNSTELLQFFVGEDFFVGGMLENMLKIHLLLYVCACIMTVLCITLQLGMIPRYFQK